jgi:hypothetical protein
MIRDNNRTRNHEEILFLKLLNLGFIIIFPLLGYVIEDRHSGLIKLQILAPCKLLLFLWTNA